MQNISVKNKNFDSLIVKDILLNSRTMFIDVKSYFDTKTFYLMKYILDFNMKELYRLLNELYIYPKQKSDGFIITLIYYILVNNEKVKNLYKNNLNLIKSNSKKYDYINYVKENVDKFNEYDDAAIFFYGIYNFSPFYDMKRKVKFVYDESIHQKIKADYFTIFKFFNHRESVNNPVLSIYDEVAIKNLNLRNYNKFAEIYGVVYDAVTLGSSPKEYVEYFVRNFQDDRSKPTQFEDILRNKISYDSLPRFKTVAEMVEYRNIHGAPDTQIIGNYEQIKQLIFTDNSKPNTDPIPKERILENENLKNYINFKLLKFKFDDRAVLNTLDYLYYYTRSGIYCEIKNNKLVKFFIFVNPEYKNNWSKLSFRGIKNYKGMTYKQMVKAPKTNDLTLDEYSKFKAYFLTALSKEKDEKPKYKREENYIPIENWWANAYVIDNVLKRYPDSPIIGKAHCNEIVNFLCELSSTSKIKDCRFFLNKRDHPMMRDDLTGPYDFLSKEKIKIEDHFAPILSWTGNDSVFRDILIPNIDDIVVSMNFCPLTSEDMSSKPILENRLKYNVDWDNRESKIIFLGSSTGSPRSCVNQRVQLCQKFRNHPLFKVAITQVNYRDKVWENNLIEFTTDDIEVGEKIPMIEQVKYKYVINVPGHSQPYRESTLFYLGFLVFNVPAIPERQSIGKMWIDLILEENIDYVNVKYDLSDLEEKLNYYIEHEYEAKRIITNAEKKINSDLNMNGFLNYMSHLLNSFNV